MNEAMRREELLQLEVDDAEIHREMRELEDRHQWVTKRTAELGGYEFEIKPGNVYRRWGCALQIAGERCNRGEKSLGDIVIKGTDYIVCEECAAMAGFETIADPTSDWGARMVAGEGR